MAIKTTDWSDLVWAACFLKTLEGVIRKDNWLDQKQKQAKLGEDTLKR